MKLFESTIDAQTYFKNGSAIAIGNYDGVHFGHRAILKSLKTIGQKSNLKTALLTFDPHPAKILSPKAAPQLINTKAQKIELLKKTGLNAVIMQSFNKSFAKTAPEDFFTKYLIHHLNVNFIYVGHDFTFGDQRKGTVETLETLGLEHHVRVKIISAKMLDQTLVSSSLIRKLIKEGNIALVNKLLTRDFFIDGNIIHGHHRGTSLGFHTANLYPDNELIPCDGVYATIVQLGLKKFKSVTNIGFNPTFDNKKRSIETHILNFDKEIYDQNMRLYFIERIRKEIRFATPAALVKQIEKDVTEAKNILTPKG